MEHVFACIGENTGGQKGNGDRPQRTSNLGERS